MKPKNVKERRNSFLKFLFLLAKLIKKESEFQNRFSDEMASVKIMIDSLNKPGTNVPLQTSTINDKLVEMHKMIPTKDSTYRYDMYQNIVNTYSDLQDTRDRLRGLRDAENEIAEYKEALKTCRADLEQAKRDLDVARASIK